MQANSSWLPTWHSAQPFATRKSIFLLLEDFFYNMRWERAVVEARCVNRGALIAALIWKVWVKIFWKSTPSKLLFWIESFSGYLWIKTSLMLKIKLMQSVRSSAIGTKTSFSWRFYRGRASLIRHRRRCLIQPFRGSLSSCYKGILVHCYDTDSWIEETTNSL